MPNNELKWGVRGVSGIGSYKMKTLKSSKSPIIWIALRKNSVFKIKKKVIIFAKLDCAVVLLNSYGLLLCTILCALLGLSY